jgi:DNA-binding response OmpR family regulator
MNLYVAEIRHAGLALVRAGSKVTSYWLPASDWAKPAEWEAFRDTAEPGMPLNVSPMPGRHATGGLQVVSIRGPGAKELSLAWKGEVHALEIESMSKKLIRGRIGAIKAVIDREEYTSFLNRFRHNDQIQDHGAIALGDSLCGLFKAERGPEGLVQVSFEDALHVLATDCENRVGTQQEDPDATPEENAGETGRPHAPLFHTPPDALSPFLFVEDDPLCRQMWKDILAEEGVEVDAYETYEEALSTIRGAGRRFKMAILDVHLRPGANDHLGLELAQALVTDQPDCRIVLSSAEDDAEYKKNTWGAFPAHGYIVKPALLEDWAATIDAAAAASQRTPLRELLSDSESQPPPIDADVLPNQQASPPTVGLDDALREFTRKAPGTSVHVFRLHPRSWRGRPLASAGGALKWEPYRGKFGKSLIRDAAMSNDPVVCNETGNTRQHLWTKAMVDYQSFWGQQLRVPAPHRYVLVAFHSNPGFFTSEMQLLARCCAETVTCVLSSQQLERRGSHDAEHSSAGLGFACLAHEIYSRLNGVELTVKHMASLLSAPDAALADNATKLRGAITRLQPTVLELVANARILRGPAGGAKPVCVAYCLKKAVEGIKKAMVDLLPRHKNITVQIETPDPGCSWMIKANAGALVTVFFNILLNAVQQIDLFAAVRPKGWTSVSARHYHDADGLPWALLFFKDSGPGIHPEDWDQIFDPGYTTKEEGTGLGLHICRLLLSRIRDGNRQASMRISASILWTGTTVTVRLPLLPT